MHITKRMLHPRGADGEGERPQQKQLESGLLHSLRQESRALSFLTKGSGLPLEQRGGDRG